MKLVESNSKFYIVELNKRGNYRQKKDVTIDLLKLVINNLSSSVLDVDGKKYLTAIRKMTREQEVVLSESKIKHYDISPWLALTGGLIGDVYAETFSILKKMYRRG